MKEVKHYSQAAIVAIIFLSTNCRNNNDENNQTMKRKGVFAVGNKIDNDNFSGTAWLNMLVNGDSIHNINIGNVTFEPGSRTRWHHHPGGQVLLVTAGKGLYQEKGKPVQFIQEGDVVKCPRDVSHWHGATAKDTMSHIAIGTNLSAGNVVWEEKVTEAEYNAGNSK
jgi:quercetin dioxygenase-like cupin family protein